MFGTLIKNFVKRFCPKAEIKIVGPIWFESMPTKLELSNDKKVISVFDIQPMNEKDFVY